MNARKISTIVLIIQIVIIQLEDLSAFAVLVLFIMVLYVQVCGRTTYSAKSTNK